MSKLIPVLKVVFGDIRVIITAVVVFLYMDFVCYIVRYRKKPAVPKTKKIQSSASSAESDGDNGSDGEADEGGEEE